MLCWAARLGRWQKAKKCRLRLLFQSQPEAQDQERGPRNSALEDRGSMQGPTLRKPAAHLQLSNRGKRPRDWSTGAGLQYTWQFNVGMICCIGSRALVTSFGLNFVEVAILNGSASRGCATATLQLSSEQTYKSDVRHRRAIGEHQRHGVRLGSLVTLAHCLGNARVLNFSMCAVKVACSLA